MFNVFTFKSKPHTMMYKNKQVEGKEKWQICKGRCRYSLKNYRTTCRLPRYKIDKNTGQPLEGVRFKIKVEDPNWTHNCKWIKKYTGTPKDLDYIELEDKNKEAQVFTTDANGET